MPNSKLIFATLLVLVVTLVLGPSLTVAADLRSYHNSLQARYSRAHSLGDNYQFDPRDGWQTVNVTNLQYKYKRDGAPNLDDSYIDDTDGDSDSQELAKRSNNNSNSHKKLNPTSHAKSKTASNTKAKSKAKADSDAKDSSSSKASATSKVSAAAKGLAGLQKIMDSLKGIGQAEPVTITWYTGHDLLNPSCWPNPSWAPSDASFACALTLEGWTTKPSCFKFLELCNSPKKCVFVRVVDSCAGCAKGSKHVDLTQAAFKELAELDKGILSVQMRQATDPEGWLENLWGPKK